MAAVLELSVGAATCRLNSRIQTHLDQRHAPALDAEKTGSRRHDQFFAKSTYRPGAHRPGAHRPHVALWASTLALLAGACAMSAVAPAVAQQTPAPAADAKSTAGKVAKPAVAAAGADAGLKSRVDSLEEQLVDMQVLVGTLESLAKSGGGSPPPAYRGGSGGGADSMRVDALENQIRALTNQVQALSDQVRSMGGTPRRSDAAAPPPRGAEPQQCL